MGGGSNNAARQAEEQERQRQLNITRGIAAVDRVYNNPSREKAIQDFLEANRQLYFGELDRQKGDADRESRFALARDGLVGSRQAVDTGIRIGEDYQKGVIGAERQAQASANSLRMADEDARRQLYALVQSGMNATTASQRATSSMQTALEGARADMKASAIGDVFAGLTDLYSRSRERATERRAQDDARALYNTGASWGYGTTGGSW